MQVMSCILSIAISSYSDILCPSGQPKASQLFWKEFRNLSKLRFASKTVVNAKDQQVVVVGAGTLYEQWRGPKYPGGWQMPR